MEKTSFKDFFLNRIFSRKLIVWAVATTLLCVKVITQDTWLTISIVYMGVNAALAAVDTIKTTKEKIVSKKSALATTTEETKVEEKEGEA